MPSVTAALVAAFLISPAAFAGTYDAFDTVVGQTVDFDNIVESGDNTTSTFSLFSGVSANGDTLDFDAFNFRHTSLAPSPFLDGRLDFNLQARPGFFITGVTVREFGSYTTINNGVAGVFLGGFASGTFGNTVVGASDTSTFVGAGGIQSGLWDATITFDNFQNGLQSDVSVQIDNRLIATGANPGDFAFIDKKLVLVTVTTAVPEPSSLAFLMGCVGVVATRRRRKLA